MAAKTANLAKRAAVRFGQWRAPELKKRLGLDVRDMADMGRAQDWEDRVFYALAPALGYLALLVAGGMALAQQPSAAAKLIAAAFVILLVAGLRNAWDMMVWIVIRAPGGVPPPQG